MGQTQDMSSRSGPERIPVIDLRSDTVTQPTDAMWDAMRHAPLGDDVLGDDPTINELEAFAAELLGKEAAVFAGSGTQSNLMGLMAHCGRGDEYLVGQHAHTYRMEGGGAAVLGSIQPQPITNRPDGTLDLAEVEANIKPHDNPHYAMTRLLALENTWNGRVLTLDYQLAAADLAKRNELGLHLDGARFFHAVVALGADAATVAAPFDTISICLSKGLGCPAGSLLIGSSELVARARRTRKMLGGGLRQAGVIGGAGLFALQHHVDRMADDHARARRLATELGALDGLSVDVDAVQTNMVFVGVEGSADDLVSFAADNGVKLLSAYGRNLRLVTHLDIDDDDIDTVVDVFARWSAAGGRAA